MPSLKATSFSFTISPIKLTDPSFAIMTPFKFVKFPLTSVALTKLTLNKRNRRTIVLITILLYCVIMIPPAYTKQLIIKKKVRYL